MSGAGVPGSPRTAAEPMAFTAREFWWGAFSAVRWFSLASLLMCLVMTFFGESPYAIAFLLYALPVSVLIALVEMLVWAGPAWALARSLRRVPSEPVHLAAFAVLGMAVGVSTILVLNYSITGGFDLSLSLVLSVFAVAAAIVVPLGRFRARRRALRADKLRADQLRADQLEADMIRAYRLRVDQLEADGVEQVGPGAVRAESPEPGSPAPGDPAAR